MIALFAALLGCAPTPTEPPPAETTVSMPVSGPSLYDLRASLVDQDGAEVSFDLDRGHPVLVTMVYTACPQACPTMIERVKRLVDGRFDARVLLISMDPTDTPEALAGIAAAHGLDPRFRLVRGEEADLRRIANLLQFRYEKLGPHDYAHGSTVVLLDANGAAVGRSDGADDAALESELAGLSANPA